MTHHNFVACKQDSFNLFVICKFHLFMKKEIDGVIFKIRRPVPSMKFLLRKQKSSICRKVALC